MTRTIKTSPELLANLRNARTIAEVMRLAHVSRRQAASVVRIACGYEIVRSSVEYTDADLAWFRRPLGAASTDGGAL